MIDLDECDFTTMRLNLSRWVDTNPSIRGGAPVIKGTRFPVSMVIANVAAGMSIRDMANDLSLDENKLRGVFEELARLFR